MDNDLTVKSTHHPGTFFIVIGRENAMRFVYNEKELIKNPCVLKVDQWRLVLKTDFKIELFELWRNGEMDRIEQRLTENGLVQGVVDSDFGKTLITSFKNCGYPAYKSEDFAMFGLSTFIIANLKSLCLFLYSISWFYAVLNKLLVCEV